MIQTDSQSPSKMILIRRYQNQENKLVQEFLLFPSHERRAKIIAEGKGGICNEYDGVLLDVNAIIVVHGSNRAIFKHIIVDYTPTRRLHRVCESHFTLFLMLRQNSGF